MPPEEKRRKHAEWKRAYRAENPGKSAEAARRQRAADPAGAKARRLVRKARDRAAERGVAFDSEWLTWRRVAAWLKEHPQCPCCARSFDLQGEGLDARGRSPSLDRLDGRLGYVAQNVNLLCWRCNTLKKDGTQKELRAVLDWMQRVGAP